MSPHQRRLPSDSRFIRWFRALGYACLTVAGALIAVTMPFDQLPWYVVMGGFLAVGGLSSALGAATERWAGEFIGLPLLTSAMWAFALLTYRDTKDPINILLLFAYGAFMFQRWLAVKQVGRIAKKGYQHGR